MRAQVDITRSVRTTVGLVCDFAGTVEHDEVGVVGFLAVHQFLQFSFVVHYQYEVGALAFGHTLPILNAP